MNRKLLFTGSTRMMARYKMRTFFMSIGIVVGVAALVSMRSMGSGAEEAMMANANRTLGTGSIVVNSGGGHAGPRAGGPITTLKIDDFAALESQISEVVAWAPLQMLPAQDIKYSGQSRQMNVFGHSENAELVWQRGVMEGEYFTQDDVGSASRVAVIGPDAADALFANEDPIGKQIRVGGVPLRIKGILEPQGIDTHGSNRDDEIHVPVTTLLRRLMNIDYVMACPSSDKLEQISV